jgi:hypothetical protein
MEELLEHCAKRDSINCNIFRVFPLLLCNEGLRY